MASDTSLVFNVLARDRASSVFARIRRAAEETGGSLRAALGPALIPIFATATAGAAGLGAALSGAGIAAAVFGGVFATSFTEVKKASDKTQDLLEKIDLLGHQIKVANELGVGDAGKLEEARAKAVNELLARYQQLPDATRDVVMAYDDLKMSWKGFVDANQPATYGLMASGFSLLSSAIPRLQPLFDTGAAAAQRLMTSLTSWSDGGLDDLITFLNGQAAPALDNLVRIVRNLFVTLGNFMGGFASQGQGILEWLGQVTDKMASWSEGNGMQKFIAYIGDNGPAVAGTLLELSKAIITIAQAVTPLGPVSLAIARALAAIIAAIPPGVLTALVAAWIAYGVAMKAYYGYTVLVGAVTKIWTGIQWLLNAAMAANPIGLVIIAIVALIAIIVLLWVHSSGFRDFFIGAWNWIKDTASSVGSWFAGPFASFFVNLWNGLKSGISDVGNFFGGVWNWIKNAASATGDWIKNTWNSVVSWLHSIPGRVGGALSGMWEGLKNSFRSAINWLISRWNNFSLTLGGGSVMGISIPSVTLATPNVPYMAKGGTVDQSGLAMVGERGPELVSLTRGAQVTPLTRSAGGSGGQVITLDLQGADQEMKRMIRKWIRTDNLLQGG